MNRIKLNQKKLKQIIRESIKSTLNEASNQGYTFNQLLGKDILGNEFRGDPKALAGYISRAYNALCKERGIQPKQLNANTPYQTDAWVQILNKAKAMDRTGTLKGIFDTMITGITAKTPQQGAQDALNNGGEMQAGNKYSTGPGDQNVAPNAGKKYTFTQLTQALGNKRGTTMSMQQVLHDSTGPWNGQDENTVRNTIQAQIKRAKPALAQSNPQNAQKAEDILNKWMQGGIPYRTDDVHWAMNVFDQALNSSRNDKPIVSGFQKLLNLFGMKDAKGRPFAVDGVIGQNTSAALQQLGYKDIFAYANDIKAVQKALGLQKIDGIAWNDTINALRNNGINSFEAIKSIARRQNPNDMANTKLSVQNNLNVPTQIPVQNQNAVPGGLAENRKFRLTEGELKQIIRESVQDVLSEMKDEEFGSENWNNTISRPNLTQSTKPVQNNPAPTQNRQRGGKVRNFARKMTDTWRQGQARMDSLRRTAQTPAQIAGQAEIDRRGGLAMPPGF